VKFIQFSESKPKVGTEIITRITTPAFPGGNESYSYPVNGKYIGYDCKSGFYIVLHPSQPVALDGRVEWSYYEMD